MLEVRAQVERAGFELDLELRAGDGVTALLGPSGSGKTTLLHLLAGLIRGASGRVVLDGTVLFDSGKGIDLPAHRRGIAVVFQDLRLFPHLDVRRNLLFGARRGGPDGPRFDEVVELLELGPVLDRPPMFLSGGQARRVALGRGLLSHPRLILLDEPLAGLDHELAGKLLPYLVRVREALRVPALYVTHVPGEVLALADRCVLLRDGRVVLEGTPENVLHDPDVFPLARAAGIENVFRGRVEERDGALRVVAGDLSFEVFPEDLRSGELVLLGIRSRDVILSASAMPGLSARNRFEGRVEELHPLGDRVLLYIRAGVRWIVELTPGAVREMELDRGAAVHLAVKTSAIEVLRPGHDRTEGPPT